ncbi:formimidoylglutamate deiminase [Rhizobium paknamense]|uniref:Formiminoglutamate deiminase n=1 Tax=Rhizobium paknamense TaxID=1206817 RepID=A0ABU0IDN3_9HYPH|nr:formimidoylglutamate deiminase [Rhizobium paknamense]MDQ0456359.1 formiminoglutamate deiminase [Rhizobium paknamense]
MKHIHATAALLETGWAKNVRIGIDNGLIASLETGKAPEAEDERHGALVPGLANLHSHAFQRAMAGLAERRGLDSDSFWSWRTLMYEMALAFTPEQLEAVAGQLYMEMLEAGCTRVGEFHYLHHDSNGQAYGDIGELAGRIVAAAETTGLSLTLLPVFYAHSGFGGAAPTAGQRRFINSVDSFTTLITRCRDLLADMPSARLGIAPHSLRAVTPQELIEILPLAEKGPIHIHVAEQMKEVEDCLAWSGARPVQWLLDHAPVDRRWTLIHATHMTEAETATMARRGAIAGLCPITEANLGDGTFAGPLFLEEGGEFGVGSDSNIRISVSEELRQFEYSQRLHLKSRNVIAAPGQSTGLNLFNRAIRGGGLALHGAGHLSIGGDADMVALDTSAVPYLSPDQVLDHWIFAGGIGVDTVWVRGQQVVREGHHIRRGEIARAFQKTMVQLLSR